MRIKLILLTLLSFLLLSCSMVSEKGSIPINLPEVGPGRALENTDTARIYLLSSTGDKNIDPTTKEIYVDVPMDKGSYLIEDIKSNNTYQLLVLFGTKVDGVFSNVTQYAAKENLKVTAGINNSIKMTIEDSKFTWNSSYTGKSVEQVLEINGSIYVRAVIDGSSVIYKDGEALEIDATDIGTIQSIGKGVDLEGFNVLWINTNIGIFPYINGDIDMDFHKGLVSNTLDISESYGLKLSDATNSEDFVLIAYFQGPGSVGGTLIDSETPKESWEWFDKESIITEMPEMESILGDVNSLIYDFVSNGNYAYLSTALPIAAFRVGSDTFSEDNSLSDDPTFADIQELLDFIVVKDSSNQQGTVTSIGLEGSTLYLGSESGLYYTEIDPATGALVDKEAAKTAGTEFAGVKNVIVGTEGLYFKKIVTTSGYIAALTNKSILVIDTKTNTITDTFKFYQGMPGKPTKLATDLAWDGTTLYVTGESGLVTKSYGN
ncbi:hypothetical protein EW093_12985 [Thiospirochaeta perfilievii]|uniref:Uncharacterized protein n=1 Tax=Thiospirochaeta perfilievii TaxID=252967 RepID=A0A5C1QEZ8_9SPIO|nr:hypothetical protein [Thiospirochaeta perfilievii]QEN05589.1 hypothetical protein EW093_12985 [Thiospirochaeta perfilievii]